MTKEWIILIFLFITIVVGWKVREETINDPLPNDGSVIILGNARFTVLTPWVIRLEYASNGHFEDNATLAIINRKTNTPPFTSKINGNVLLITTNFLSLSYNASAAGGRFEPESLQINVVNGDLAIANWNPGTPSTGNLNGTFTSLNCYNTSCETGFPLYPGLLSTDGWVLFDDSDNAIFFGEDSSGIQGILSPQKRNGGNCNLCKDWYFLGHGQNYKQALYDFTLISGPISIPPSSAFGSWWSRWYAYSGSQLIDEVISGYHNYSLPLNHVVLDMDWHVEYPEDTQCNKWGGYSWNRTLFPDPPSFIDYLHSPENNLKLLLNLHPETGVDPCQDKYQQIADEIGFDTSTNETIGCNFMDLGLAEAMFSEVMDYVGNDYWWTDYLGCNSTGPFPWTDNVTGDLLYSNYMYHSQLEVRGKRPLVLTRFGGPGNHRYPVGFSGDTYSVYPTLQYQLYFTQTAANILYGYWSHGFEGNPDPDEMFLRWIQFGTVAPIFRIHSNHEERRVWTFPSFELMKDAMMLRNALGPYIYTYARYAFDFGISLVHPLYYDFPTYPEAYSYIHQYKFGENILAAPVVTPVDPTTNTTIKTIWLPPGEWIHFFSLKSFTGPLVLNLTVGLSDLPLFVVAGAIIPMKTMASVTQYNPDPLLFVIYPGSSSSVTEYYEDDGETTEYLNGAFSFTSVSYSTSGSTTKITAEAVTGSFIGQPSTRTYQFVLKGASSPSSVLLNGYPVEEGQKGPAWWTQDGDLYVQTPVSVFIDTQVVITF